MRLAMRLACNFELSAPCRPIQQNSIDAVPHFCSKWLCPSAVPSMPPLALSSAASPSPLSFCPAPPSFPSPPCPDVPRSPSPLLHLASGQLHGLAVLQGAGTDLRALRYRCGRTRAFRSTASTCTPLMHALEATPFSRCPTACNSYSPPCACEPSLWLAHAALMSLSLFVLKAAWLATANA